MPFVSQSRSENLIEDENDEWIMVRKDPLIRLLDINDDELAEEANPYKASDEQMAYCNKLGFRNFPQWLQATNQLAKAEKGNLMKPDKKAPKK